MTRYNAQYIEETFKRLASLRINQKRRGDKRYTGDAGYWEGGRCDYGGAHNLQEDCQRLGKFFGDITELKDSRRKLINFNTQEEFEKNKQNLLSKTNQALSGLRMKTSSNTSIGGICIIWDDFSSYLNQIVTDFRKEVEVLKDDIERVPYNEARELRKLEQEEGKLKREIEENEQKARNESDPEKKKKFIFFADEAKTKWKKVLERKKQLKSASLGDNFNPDKHIGDFLTELENKLAGKNRSPRNQQNSTNANNFNPNQTENSEGTSKPNTPFNPFQPNSNPTTNKDWFQENRNLLILVGATFLIILYLYSQQNTNEYLESNNLYNYNF